jgi:hypothetical protein
MELEGWLGWVRMEERLLERYVIIHAFKSFKQMIAEKDNFWRENVSKWAEEWCNKVFYP